MWHTGVGGVAGGWGRWYGAATRPCGRRAGGAGCARLRVCMRVRASCRQVPTPAPICLWSRWWHEECGLPLKDMVRQHLPSETRAACGSLAPALAEPLLHLLLTRPCLPQHALLRRWASVRRSTTITLQSARCEASAEKGLPRGCHDPAACGAGGTGAPNGACPGPACRALDSSPRPCCADAEQGGLAVRCNHSGEPVPQLAHLARRRRHPVALYNGRRHPAGVFVC